MSISAPHTASPPSRALRVMIVDDAVVVRGIFTRWLSQLNDMTVVGAARNGREALDRLADLDPDVVILDIDMPELDGITVLPLLLERKRNLIVIMASTLTRRNAEVSLRALSLGAADYITKPSAGYVTTWEPFRDELITKIRHLGAGILRAETVQSAQTMVHVEAPSLVPRAGRVSPVPGSANRPFSAVPPRAVVIGASTGGPQALALLMTQLRPVVDRVPVVVVQHMPAMFTAILADNMSRNGAHPAHEVKDGEVLRAGTIYIAPGGRHLRIGRSAQGATAILDDSAPLHFCRPAVDITFSSAATVWGAATLALVLTGMGVDGAEGVRAIAAAGGSVIAQDEASSVVWGMPGAAVATGACSAVLPLTEIAPRIQRLFAGERV